MDFPAIFLLYACVLLRYVNPKLQATLPSADIDVGGASDMLSLRKKAIAGSLRSKKGRLH